ncbi:helix-turn-helix transcriptional regulator [Enterococcus nangangensis]|uniref:helix-turn-helix transcriptional regulator n=1 Tax=Enterococcus nangangensis TaxID=2559926 RepID=UPI0010F52EB4|nr:AraC family transcriptional regulator [Enterococcus nangangensis]
MNKILSKKSNDSILSANFDLHYQKNEAIDGVDFHPENHYHEFHELFFLIEGEVDFFVETARYHLTAGNTLLIHHHDIHQAILNNITKYHRVFIYLDPSLLKKYNSVQTPLDYCFSSIDGHHSHLIQTSLEDILPYLRQLERLQRDKSYGKDTLALCTMLELLIFLNQTLIDQEELLDKPLVTVTSPLIKATFEYIQENIAEPFTVQDLAQNLYVSRGHLSREFKNYTGVTLHAYILKRRLLLAKKYIAQNETISNAALQCGFVDTSYFIRAFKKEFQITPKQYQKKINKTPFLNL